MNKKVDPLKIIEELEIMYIQKIQEAIIKGDFNNVNNIENMDVIHLQEIIMFKERIQPELNMYRDMVSDNITIDLVDEYNKRRKNELKSLISRTKDVLEVEKLKEKYRNELKEEREIDDIIKKLNSNEKNLSNKIKNEAAVKFGKIDDRRFLAILDEAAGKIDNQLLNTLREVDDYLKEIPLRGQLMKTTDKVTMVEAIYEINMDFIDRGVNSVVYRNGSKHNIRSYSEMVLRTSRQRAALRAEASVREDIDMPLVQVSSHGLSCPKCAAWEHKVLIDDVYQDGNVDLKYEGKYKKLSEAIESGLFHPNCRHTLLPFREDYLLYDNEEVEVPYTKEDERMYKMTQVQRGIERNIRAYKRKEAISVSDEQKEKYKQKIRNEQKKIRKLLKEEKYLKRKRWREQIE